MEEGGDVLDEADREADLLEQVPLRGQHPGFVFLAVLALRSGEYIETCDIYREQHSCRCYVLPEHHKIISMQQRPFDVREATTQSRDLKHTKYHTLDLARSITKWESIVFEIVDSVGIRFSILNAVCMGTTFDQSMDCEESETLGSPSSHACLRAFVHGWTRWAGWPGLVRCDRGTHNGGVFSSTLAKNGVVIRPTGWKRQGQLGRVERRGDMLKKMMSKVIKVMHASGRESTDMILSECLNAANEMTRHGGCAPAQWVLSRLPCSLATMGDEDECLDVGALQAHANGPTTFGVQSRYRSKAREAFVRWRKAALVIGSYQVGDIDSYCREPRVNTDCNGV